MAFVKGQSGNPGGRPKGYQDLQAAARAHSKAALETLVRALSDDKLCVQAATAILDRGFGKPPQAHTGEGGEGPVKMLIEWAKSEHSGS